jgi:hypothetical protein
MATYQLVFFSIGNSLAPSTQVRIAHAILSMAKVARTLEHSRPADFKKNMGRIASMSKTLELSPIQENSKPFINNRSGYEPLVDIDKGVTEAVDMQRNYLIVQRVVL